MMLGGNVNKRTEWYIKEMSLIVYVLMAMALPINADGDKYYGTFVGNFQDRFHGIKGEVSAVFHHI